MMTERIYYEDVYCTSFTAVLEEIREENGKVWIRLNRTAFYPEGGGQPCDIGAITFRQQFGGSCETILHTLRVVDVRDREDAVWHCVETDEITNDAAGKEQLKRSGLITGTQVKGEINRQRRLDLMQQHSGEHIVSGLIHARYGYDNVGFHLTMDSMTIDLSGELSWKELMEIESAVNRLVREDRPVEISYPSPDELCHIPYRSKKELTGQVRIVTIPGGDICACCGTHVSHTGEIGLVKLTAMQKWKNGIRVWLCCGERAEEYCRMLQEQNRRISVSLSAKPEETAAAVERLSGEINEVKADLSRWKGKLFDQIAEKYRDAGQAVLFEDDLSMDDLRHLADKLMDVCRGVCYVFSGSDGDGYRYAVGKRGGDIRGLVKEMNRILGGRGGGKPELAQGTVQAGQKEIRDFIENDIG